MKDRWKTSRPRRVCHIPLLVLECNRPGTDTSAQTLSSRYSVIGGTLLLPKERKEGRKERKKGKKNREIKLSSKLKMEQILSRGQVTKEKQQIQEKR